MRAPHGNAATRRVSGAFRGFVNRRRRRASRRWARWTGPHPISAGRRSRRSPGRDQAGGNAGSGPHGGAESGAGRPLGEGRSRACGSHRAPLDPTIPSPRLRHVSAVAKDRRHGRPCPGLAPAAEAPIDLIPVAVPPRHVPPRRARAQPPKDAVDHGARVFRRPPAMAPRRRQQRLHLPPFRCGQIASTQWTLPSRFQSSIHSRHARHAFLSTAYPSTRSMVSRKPVIEIGLAMQAA